MNFLNKFNLSKEPTVNSGFMFQGSYLTLITLYNPLTGQSYDSEKRSPDLGFAGYIGLLGTKEKVNEAVKFIKDNCAAGNAQKNLEITFN